LLLLGQLAYVPNAVIWAISFTLGPGFAFGTGTVIAPTGSALGAVPAFPMLAALPPGVHAVFPPSLSAIVLVIPYLAGAFGGWLTTRAAPLLALEAAPLWGFACGALTGLVLAVLSAFAGGPLGNGRLAAVGPSGWQVGVVAALEVGVAAAVASGVTNWLRLRARKADSPAARVRVRARAVPPASGVAVSDLSPDARAADGHTIYLDPWAGMADEDSPGRRASAAHGPSSLP
jgi:hypothetical protein